MIKLERERERELYRRSIYTIGTREFEVNRHCFKLCLMLPMAWNCDRFNCP